MVNKEFIIKRYFISYRIELRARSGARIQIFLLVDSTEYECRGFRGVVPPKLNPIKDELYFNTVLTFQFSNLS